MTEPSSPPIRVLLVEEEPEDLEGLRRTFAQEGDGRFRLEWVGQLSEALQRISLGGVDVVLLDLHLPDSQGVVTFERANAFAPDLPFVILTSEDDETEAMSTVQGGAQDYLVKGQVDPRLLTRSLRYALERHRLMSDLRNLSLIDDLTGLYNRRGFMDLGEHHLSLARRSGRSLTLVYTDLDDFKTINDTWGHHVGDRGLVKVAELLRATFRRSDLVGRLGGDEFAVLAVEASGEDADLLVRRLKARLDELNTTGTDPFELSLSVGLARYEDGVRMRLDDLLARADQAMYEEKHRKSGEEQ